MRVSSLRGERYRRGAESLKVAEAFRIHTFIATSPMHIATKLRSTLDEVIERAIYMVKRARNYTDDVEFSCEDAGRTPIADLARVVEAAINAGATTINIPDTVGYTMPFEFAGIISGLYERVPNIDKAIISVHTHDDLGLAVGNSLAAVHAGARQVEGAMNGIGERAGNCSLEEVIMAIKVRKDILNVHTAINHQEIWRTSQLVSQICNMPIPANKAIVGSGAFAHSSGIHQDGVLKNRENYEIMTPESIGLNQIQLNLTSRSGRAAVKHRMDEMGYKESEYNLDNLYDAFLKLADKKVRCLITIWRRWPSSVSSKKSRSISVWITSACSLALTISPPPPSNWPVAKKSKQKPPTVTVRSMPSIRQLTASLNITSNW